MTASRGSSTSCHCRLFHRGSPGSQYVVRQSAYASREHSSNMPTLDAGKRSILNEAVSRLGLDAVSTIGRAPGAADRE